MATGFNVETVEYKNISFTVWDVGGQDKVRCRRVVVAAAAFAAVMSPCQVQLCCSQRREFAPP